MPKRTKFFALRIREEDNSLFDALFERASSGGWSALGVKSSEPLTRTNVAGAAIQMLAEKAKVKKAAAPKKKSGGSKKAKSDSGATTEAAA